jgi:UDPglucose--hexose-1-phosphate uridylyltransferase
MPQFRKDPFGPTWVIISPERGLEASDFGSALSHSGTCNFCPGHEHLAGPEVRALRPSTSGIDQPDWRARIVRSDGMFMDSKPFQPQGEPLFTHALSSGYQETIIEHPRHDMRLDDMPLEHLVELLKLYRGRLEYLSGKPGIRHIQLTRNVGRVAGAVSDHPHAQLLALPVPNRWVQEEHTAAKAHGEQTGSCLFCDVISAELKDRVRLVTYNEAFIAIAPYAAKTPFETWILPRQHTSSFCDLPSNNMLLVADLLQAVLKAINTSLNYPPYNMLLHTLPKGGEHHYHWNLKIIPRLTSHAGFDWSSGFYVNPTPPEDAVRFLRESMALQAVEQ